MDLSYAERIRNVRGAFVVRRDVQLYQARLLLVDDVKTTGATINECAKVLRRAGAAEVYAAVLVTAPWHSDRRTSSSSI
jgi:predicted amidophosphoribosyltransferase